MKQKDIITLVVLLLLTILTSLSSTYLSSVKYVVAIIMGIALIKFILITFQFMELKKANAFWKFLMITYGLLFFVIITTIVGVRI